MRKQPKQAGINWIYEYYQGIENGKYLVGKWIRLAYAYVVRGIEQKLFVFDAKKANDAISWIETHGFHTEGILAPGPLMLEVWQKALLSVMFGVVDDKGNRQFREILLVVGRKNGKSAFATAIANYVFREYGGYGTRVYCIAPKLDQADIIYNNLWCMITLDPEWQREKEILSARDHTGRKLEDDSSLVRHRQTDLAIPATNSTVKKIAFSAKKSDGFNPNLCICDEVACWEGDKGLKQYEVLKSAMGSRPDAFMLSCTTSGYINDSIYDELIRRSTRFLLGDSKERRLFPALYMVDDLDKWNDLNELRKSNPNLGVSVMVDFLIEEIAIAEGSLSKKAEFITKYCCLKQNSSLAWLPAKVVEDASGEQIRLEDFRDTYCIGGIDLSQTRDLTACCALIERDGQLFVVTQFFLPAEKLEEAKQRDGVPYDIYVKQGFLKLSGDNFVDYHDCYQWFVDLVEKYQIYPLQIGYDRYSAQYLIQDLQAYGFHCDDVYQGDNLHGVIQETQGILEDRRLHIGDNSLLKMHLLDSAIKMNVERGRGKLVKLSGKAHIDGAAALLDAMTVRQKYYSEIGEQLRN